MPWTEIGLHSLGLLLYPGLIALVVLGVGAEAVAAWLMVPERGGPGLAGRALLESLRPHGARPMSLPPLASVAGLMAVLAASQIAAPFNPVPADERNLMIAAAALMGAAWAAWTWGWERPGFDPRLVLVVQGCWVVSLLAPAIVPENLRPQALGAIEVSSLLPLKLAAGLLYLLCLPVLLQLIAEAAPQGLPGAAGRRRPDLEQAGFGVVRMLLWLPYCGLFTSLFFPPSTDDAVGLARFAAITLGVAALSIGIAANLQRRPATATQALYRRVVAPFAAFTIAVAIGTSIFS